MVSFRVITRNILSNWVAFAIQVMIAFGMTPFILGEIGDTRYGVWAIIVSIIGYYGLLDLGMRAGMTQYITRYYAIGDFDRMNRSASSGFALHVACAIGVLGVTAIVARGTPSMLSLASPLGEEARWCVLIVGCSTAAQFLLFPFSVPLTAKQRFDIVTLVGTSSRILSAVLMVIALRSGHGLVGLCLASAVTNVLDYLVRSVISHQLLPEMRISLAKVNWVSCRECVVFGSWSALISAGTLLIGFTDALVIGTMMPVSAVAFFALANNLIKYFASIFIPVGHVFFPAATALDATDDLTGLRRLYLTASRMVALMAISLALITSIWAKDFYLLWVGQTYIDADIYHSVPLLYQVLMVGAVFTAAQRIGSKVLLGRRQTQGLARLFLLEAAANLAISISLIGPLGLLGVAIGTVIPAVFCQGILHPIMVCSNLGLGWREYARDIVRPTALLIVILTPILVLTHQFCNAATWATLLLSGAVAATISVLSICLVGLRSSDRHRFLYPLLRRLPGMPRTSLPENC